MPSCKCARPDARPRLLINKHNNGSTPEIDLRRPAHHRALALVHPSPQISCDDILGEITRRSRFGSHFFRSICTKTRSKLSTQSDFPGSLKSNPSRGWHSHGRGAFRSKSGTRSLHLPASFFCRPKISTCFRKLIIKYCQLLLSCTIARVEPKYIMLSLSPSTAHLTTFDLI